MSWRRTTVVLAACVGFVSLPLTANATSSRENNYAVGPGVDDTMKVRIIWDSSTVAGDMIYYYGHLNPQTPYTANIWMEINGSPTTNYYINFSPSNPVVQCPCTLVNFSQLDAYITRVQYSYNQYLTTMNSPVISV